MLSFQLTLILPTAHDAIAELLTEKFFDAGPCTIVVHSCLTHHEAGQYTLSRNKPLITVRHNNDFLNFVNPGQSIEAFSAVFAAALREAQIHAMKVEKFIRDQINESIVEAVASNRNDIQEKLREGGWFQ